MTLVNKKYHIEVIEKSSGNTLINFDVDDAHDLYQITSMIVHKSGYSQHTVYLKIEWSDIYD